MYFALLFTLASMDVKKMKELYKTSFWVNHLQHSTYTLQGFE